MLLVVEDLHWADRSTREALAFLARSLAGERVLVVVTYRPDELDRRHPLRPLLAELEPAAGAPRAARPLSRDELAEQVGDIAGTPPTPSWSSGCGSAPAATRCSARSSSPPARRPRRGARHAARRADAARGSALRAAREPAALVAVGERLDHGLLAETSGLEERALRDALREAVDGHVLAVDDDGVHRFRHALLREVVEDDLLPGERAPLHLALGQALERRLDGRRRRPGHRGGRRTTSAPRATARRRWPPRCAPPRRRGRVRPR